MFPPINCRQTVRTNLSEGGSQLGQAEVRGVSHGLLSSNCTVVMLRIETPRDINQDLTALEQMSDGFLDSRHRINGGDGDS